MSEKQEQAKRWLEAQEAKAELRDSEAEAAKTLVGHAGFAALLSLLGAERQGCYVALSYVNLEDKAGRREGSVLQGKIAGIERARETLLELFATTSAPTEEKTR